MEGRGRQAAGTVPQLQASNPVEQVEFHRNMKYVNAERYLTPSRSALLRLAHLSACAVLN